MHKIYRSQFFIFKFRTLPRACSKIHRVFSINVITCLTEFNEYLIHFSISPILTMLFSWSTFELVLSPKPSPLTHWYKKGAKLIYCWLTASLNLLDIQFLYPFFFCVRFIFPTRKTFILWTCYVSRMIFLCYFLNKTVYHFFENISAFLLTKPWIYDYHSFILLQMLLELMKQLFLKVDR